MWPRVVETMLGIWLMISPFIFDHPLDRPEYWYNDLGCSVLVMALALTSYWKPMRHAHLGIVLVAVWLIAFGYFREPYPTPPALQNNVTIGLLLLMFSIIPTDCSRPPAAWREFHRRSADNTAGASVVSED